MTARSHPEQPDFASDAERIVWQTLVAQLPDDAHVFVDRRFTDRDGDCEADLLVAWPEVGIGAVEVKGGHVAMDADGVWRQSGRWGAKDVDPVRQAQRCRYALRAYLDRHPGWGRGHVRMQHLVAFPASHIAADVQSTDCPRWLVVDHDDLPHMARRLREALHGSGGGPRTPSLEDVDALVRCLEGRPESPWEAVAADVRAREHAVEALTAQQAKVLDAIRLLHRVEVRGGAGSGKTWLAIEQARRLAADGKRVGLLCYSRGLAVHLKQRTDRLPRKQRPAYVGTFHGLGRELGAESGPDEATYWEQVLPDRMGELADALPDGARFDAFVVDEAQDFAERWWLALLAALRDRDAGAVYAFSDEGQRVFSRFGAPPVQLLPIALDENLRNTKPIAQSFSSLVGEPQRIRGGPGDPVELVPCTSDTALAAADDAVRRLVDKEGWSAEHVALLTTGRRHPVQVEGQVLGHDAYWDGFYADAEVFYGHVLGFKGLERPAVVLAVNGFGAGEGDRREKEKLYVGLSRARDRLVVCGDPAVIREVGGDGVARRLGIT